MSATASRFACLPDDDAADWKGLKQKQKKEEKKNEANKSKDKNKDKSKSDAKELQSIAFGGGSNKKKNKKKNNKQNSSSKEDPVQNISSNKEETSQFDEWKERDKAVTEDSFSAALQEAILQSQLEFEELQAVTAAQKQLLETGMGPEEVLATLSKEDRKKVGKMQKKNNTMSLDQFNNQPTDSSSGQAKSEVLTKPEPQLYRHPRHKDRAGNGNGIRDSPEKEVKGGQRSGGDFFNEIDVATELALNREELLESFKRNTASDAIDTKIETLYQQKLVATETQLLEARLEIQSLNQKLTEAKLRTKKLTEILLSGEMKEKTEVLVQVHKLEKVRDELVNSLGMTTGQLEQERSLVSLLEQEIRKSGAKGGEGELGARLLNIIKTSRK